jgi:hypothetical protein
METLASLDYTKSNPSVVKHSLNIPDLFDARIPDPSSAQKSHAVINRS